MRAANSPNPRSAEPLEPSAPAREPPGWLGGGVGSEPRPAAPPERVVAACAAEDREAATPATPKAIGRGALANAGAWNRFAA